VRRAPAEKRLSRRLLYYLSVRVIRLAMFLFCHWQVEGRENVPRCGPLIVAPNHISYLDPPVAGSALDRQLYFMAKVELFAHPFLGWLIRQYGAFPVQRGVADRAAMRHAERLLRAGHAVLVFPDGTRSPDGRLTAGELGIALLALRTGAPVLPIGVDGTDRVMPRGTLLMRPARVRIRIGPPISFDDLCGPPLVGAPAPLTRETLEEALRRIIAALAELLPAWRTTRVRRQAGAGASASSPMDDGGASLIE
jgi:1-acyl-sn-glycerol-3-phosphate acyltransferase